MFNGNNVIEINTFFDGTEAVNSLSVAGKHVVGLNTTAANTDLKAVAMKSGQSACFNELNNCVSWTDGKLSYLNRRGEVVFSVDEDGNAFFKGHVSQAH